MLNHCENQIADTIKMQSYRSLQWPFVKVFIGAMFIYQVSYWSWEKLRTDEIVGERSAEVTALEERIKDYKLKKQSSSSQTPIS